MVRSPLVAALFAASLSYSGALAQQPDPQQDDPNQVGVNAGALAKKTAFELELRHPAAGERPFATRTPATISLVQKAPAEIKQLPNLRSNSPLFGLVRLGRGGKQFVILDQSAPNSRQYDLLWIDRDRDESFTAPDELEPVKGALTHDEGRDLDYVEFTALPITVYYGAKNDANDGTGRIEDSCRFTFYGWLPRSGDPAEMTRLFVSLASWREGRGKLAGKDARVVLFDDSGIAMYAIGTSRWALLELEPDAPLPKDLALTACSVPLPFAGKPYRITGVMPEARTIDLAEESVDSAQQALLDSDPFQLEPPRPRAEKPIEWLSDFAEAEKAAKQQKKPICVFYAADWSKIAGDLEQRTLQDAEVAELLRSRFVCVKLNPSQARWRSLAAQHDAQVVPTMVFIDGSGNVLERVVGYRQARSLADVLRRTRG